MADEIDHTDEWVNSIGHFITGFAYVERLVYELYDLLPSDRLSSHGREQKDYSTRARLLQALLRSSDWSQRERLSEHLESSIELAALRNQLAHNPMFIEVWIDGERNDHEIRQVIQDSKKGHDLEHITLPVLKAKLEKLHSISSALAEIVWELVGDAT